MTVASGPVDGCLSCEIVGAETATEGTVLETAHVHAHQDVAYPVPGFVIVASRRHVRALDELDDHEAADLMAALRSIRAAQRTALGVESVYYFYNEDTRHHLHVWMIPRHPWMATFGQSVESVRPALQHARETVTPSRLSEVREAVGLLRDALTD